MHVDVCICTFRRGSIFETLQTIAEQSIRGEVDLHVIVADNDTTPVAAGSIIAACSELNLPLTYVHAPAENISIARNACLDACSNDWIVFIDDDEIASHDWLDVLLRDCESIDVRFGVSQALYDPSETPAWILQGDFHSNRIMGNDASHNGYTCNVLLRRDFLEAHGLRFDLALGQTGGEDTLMFERINLLGGRFDYSADAIVYEAVPPSRASLKWLIKRKFRAGQIHREVLRTRGISTRGSVPAAAAKVLYCSAASLANAFRPADRNRHLLRATLHLGFIVSSLGGRTYREYGSPGMAE